MQWRDQHGFTIIEALVTLAIVASGVFTLLVLARQVTETVAWSRQHLVAAVLADAFVAAHLGVAMVATPADCLERNIGGCMETLDASGRPTGALPAYVRRWRVAPLPGAPSPAWSVVACVVPVGARRVPARPSGACVARVMSAVEP